MADEQKKPAMDLAGIAGGSTLKHVEAVADNTLAQASILAAIKGQGVISVPAERLPKESNEALNRGLIMKQISSGGEISAQIDHSKDKPSPALAQGLVLNAIKTGGEKLAAVAAPDRAMTSEKLVALQEEAASEKKEIGEALVVHKTNLPLGDLANVELKHVDAPVESHETRDRGSLLMAVKAKGGAVANVDKIPVKDAALAQASMLSAIKTGGVISVPAGAVPDRALTDEQKAALLEDAQAEKKEDADNLDAHKKVMNLGGIAEKRSSLVHVPEPVADNSATIQRGGLLNELKKAT